MKRRTDGHSSDTEQDAKPSLLENKRRKKSNRSKITRVVRVDKDKMNQNLYRESETNDKPTYTNSIQMGN